MQLIREGFQLIYAHEPAAADALPACSTRRSRRSASVGVELYPDFNVFEVAKPYARDLVLQRFTPQRLLGQARKETTSLARRCSARRRTRWHDFLEQVRDGQIEVGFVHKGLDEFMPRIDRASTGS